MSSDESERGSAGKQAGAVIGGLLKKAVEIGAATYVTGEEAAKKIGTAQAIPQEIVKETLERFFQAYSLVVKAEIRFEPKKKKTQEDETE